MKFFSLLLFFVTFGLCSCATVNLDDPTYWVGRPATELITVWGEPNYRISNSRHAETLIFNRSRQTELMTGMAYSHPPGLLNHGEGPFVPTFEQTNVEETIVFTVNSDGFIFESK